MLWTLKEAAVALRVSQSWLRASNCPRFVIPTSGERAMLRFDPMETRDWVNQWHQRHATSRERVA